MLIERWMEGNEMNVRGRWNVESVPGSGTYDTPADPTTVTFTVRRRPDPATAYVYGVDGQVTREAPGVFRFKHIPAPGRWFVHAAGTGAATGAEEIEYEIDDSKALAA